MSGVTLAEYPQMVKQLAKPGEDILASLEDSLIGDQKVHLIHMVMGVSGESGELLDAIKKFTIYGKDLDRENVIEELGDLEFYLEGIRQSLSITRDETLQANIDKLGKRYHRGVYSDDQAQNRADKTTA